MKKTAIANLGLKLLAVAIAFLIWLVVVNENDPVSTRSYSGVNVETPNVDSLSVDQTFSIQNDSDIVKIWVTARKSILDKLQAKDFTAVADFRNLTETNGIPYMITCTNTSINRSNWVCEPSSMQIKLENVVQGSFGVNVVTSGKPADGYEVGTTSIAGGDTITISGPESVINIIDVVTVPIDVNGMEKSGRERGNIKVTDKNGTDFSESQMKNLTFMTSNGELIGKNRLSVQVELWEVHQNIALDIDTVGTPTEGYRVTAVTATPEAVALAGSATAFDEIGETLAIPDQISVEGVTESFETSLNLEEYLADNYKRTLRVASGAASTISVKITIEKAGTRTFELPIAELSISGQTQDYDMSLSPADKLSIEVEAVTGTLSELTLSDIRAGINLSAYTSAGHYVVPVNIVLPEGYELVSPVTIVVNLSEKEAENQSTIEEE